MDICKKIIEQTTELFSCDDFGEYIKIETPFLYPDGDVIDIFYRKILGLKQITDLGGLSNWISLQIISDDRTTQQQEKTKYIYETYRIESKDGELFIDLEKRNESRTLAEAIFDLAQGIIRLAGLWFQKTSKIKNKASKVIESFMEINNIEYTKNKHFSGASGDNWKINFYTENEFNQKFLIYILSAEKKESTPGIIYRINTAWDDLFYLKEKRNENYEFISLIDDRYNTWQVHQKRILKRKSKIKLLSNRNDLKNTLVGVTS